MSVLTVDGLVKHFPIAGSRSVVQAVNGVSFSVAKGETLALVGESGSGKTTVGRCVLGLIKSTDGSIGFQGKPVDRQRNIRSRELRGKLQLVFQEPAESPRPAGANRQHHRRAASLHGDIPPRPAPAGARSGATGGAPRFDAGAVPGRTKRGASSSGWASRAPSSPIPS